MLLAKTYRRHDQVSIARSTTRGGLGCSANATTEFATHRVARSSALFAFVQVAFRVRASFHNEVCAVPGSATASRKSVCAGERSSVLACEIAGARMARRNETRARVHGPVRLPRAQTWRRFHLVLLFYPPRKGSI